MLPRSHSSTDGGSTNPVWRSTSRKLHIRPLPWCTNQRAMPHYGLDRTKSDRLLDEPKRTIDARQSEGFDAARKTVETNAGADSKSPSSTMLPPRPKKAS